MKKSGALSGFLLTLTPTMAFAADKIDTGDTAWVLVSTALVMMMTPEIGRAHV